MALETISHYRIIKKLGAGGMGEVYLAEDTRLDRKVALKLLPEEFTKDGERLRRFTQEAKAVSALNHPNIITIYDIGQTDPSHFIATEYVEGVTLRQHMRRAGMSVSEVLDIAVQIASALSAAHQVGIIHRDVKPENVMLRADGLVKLLDFGLAKLTEQQVPSADTSAPTVAQVNTGPNVILGTLAYMSPEQARGKDIDSRTDVFSFGVLLYQMVTGHAPFVGETTSDIIAAILKSEPEPLSHHSPEAPAELQTIISKALRKDREARYRTMKDMLADLKSLRQELEFMAKLERSASSDSSSKSAATGGAAAVTVAEQLATTTRASAPTISSAKYIVSEIRRHKRVAAVTFIMLLLGCVGLYFLLRPTQPKGTGPLQPNTISSLAVLPFVNASGDAEIEYLSDGITESLINSLSQLPSLSVKARSTVFRYKGKDVEPQQVGSELNVQAVLSGRVVRRGDQLTLGLELADARTGNQIWGEQYNRKLADLVMLQGEIARDISNKLRVKLSGADEQKLAKNYTENIEAYDLYLRGRFYWNKRTPQDLQKAIEYFNQAVNVDPNFALAYAGVADAYSLAPNYGSKTPREVMPKAKEAAFKAVSLDNSLAEAHAALANTLTLFDYDFSEAEREYLRAIELNANYATAHQWYGDLLVYEARFEEGFAELRRALEIDPLSLAVNWSYGINLFHARKYAESIAQIKKTLELEPNFQRAHLGLAIIYQVKGDYAESVEAYARAQEVAGDRQAAEAIRESFAKYGVQGYWRFMTDGRRASNASPYSLAGFYAQLGEKDKAFAELNKSYENRAFQMVLLKVDPRLDPLRDDPRFQDLLSRVGLPQ